MKNFILFLAGLFIAIVVGLNFAAADTQCPDGVCTESGLFYDEATKTMVQKTITYSIGERRAVE